MPPPVPGKFPFDFAEIPDMPEAGRLGFKAIHLEVERRNQSAFRLYQHLGFEDHDRTLMTFTPNAP